MVARAAVGQRAPALAPSRVPELRATGPNPRSSFRGRNLQKRDQVAGMVATPDVAIPSAKNLEAHNDPDLRSIVGS